MRGRRMQVGYEKIAIFDQYLNSELRCNYFRFGEKRPPYWNSTFGFNLDHFAVICMLFCIMLPNFVQIGKPTAEI